MTSCSPNDVCRRGYSLDWDGPVSVCSYSRRPNDVFRRGYSLDWYGRVPAGLFTGLGWICVPGIRKLGASSDGARADSRD